MATMANGRVSPAHNLKHTAHLENGSFRVSNISSSARKKRSSSDNISDDLYEGLDIGYISF